MKISRFYFLINRRSSRWRVAPTEHQSILKTLELIYDLTVANIRVTGSAAAKLSFLHNDCSGKSTRLNEYLDLLFHHCLPLFFIWMVINIKLMIWDIYWKHRDLFLHWIKLNCTVKVTISCYYLGVVIIMWKGEGCRNIIFFRGWSSINRYIAHR